MISEYEKQVQQMAGRSLQKKARWILKKLVGQGDLECTFAKDRSRHQPQGRTDPGDAAIEPFRVGQIF